MWAPAGRRVVWFLLSDSVVLRNAAAQAFGSKVLTSTTQVVQVRSGWRVMGLGFGATSLKPIACIKSLTLTLIVSLVSHR